VAVRCGASEAAAAHGAWLEDSPRREIALVLAILGAPTVRARYDGIDDLWSPLPTRIAPAGAFCKSLVPERQAARATPTAATSESATARSA
jgi:hypothetical protein